MNEEAEELHLYARDEAESISMNENPCNHPACLRIAEILKALVVVEAHLGT